MRFGGTGPRLYSQGDCLRVRFTSCTPSSAAALHTRQDHRLSAVYAVEIDEGGKGWDRIGSEPTTATGTNGGSLG